MCQSKSYVVVVREGNELFLFLRIARNKKGESFVMFPREDKAWNPHASLHADGTHHQKSFDRKFAVRKTVKPDGELSETVNLVTIGIAADEPRKINTPCGIDQFSEVFEISPSDLRPERYRTNISIDLIPQNGEAIVPKSCRIIRQHIFQDDGLPSIMVTLYDTKSITS